MLRTVKIRVAGRKQEGWKCMEQHPLSFLPLTWTCSAKELLVSSSIYVRVYIYIRIPSCRLAEHKAVRTKGGGRANQKEIQERERVFFYIFTIGLDRVREWTKKKTAICQQRERGGPRRDRCVVFPTPIYESIGGCRALQHLYKIYKRIERVPLFIADCLTSKKETVNFAHFPDLFCIYSN